MLYIYLPVSYYNDNIHVTEGAYAGGLLSQQSFLFVLVSVSLDAYCRQSSLVFNAYMLMYRYVKSCGISLWYSISTTYCFRRRKTSVIPFLLGIMGYVRGTFVFNGFQKNL